MPEAGLNKTPRTKSVVAPGLDPLTLSTHPVSEKIAIIQVGSVGVSDIRIENPRSVVGLRSTILEVAGKIRVPGNLQNGTSEAHYAPGIFYSNGRYPNGSYLNDGNLLGNWMGRQSQGVQAWSNYRFSPRSFIQASFRHQKVSQQYMPGVGTLTDVSLRADCWLRNDLSVSGTVQYERWLYPVITPGAQSNVTTSLQLVFWPQSWKR